MNKVTLNSDDVRQALEDWLNRRFTPAHQVTVTGWLANKPDSGMLQQSPTAVEFAWNSDATAPLPAAVEPVGGYEPYLTPEERR